MGRKGREEGLSGDGEWMLNDGAVTPSLSFFSQ